MLVSKAYHCLVLSLSCVGVWATATRLSVCSSTGSDIDPCSSGPATDVAISFGATLAIASCGGLRHYFKSAQMQIQINEHLLASIESEGLMSHLHRQKTTDGLITATWAMIKSSILLIVGNFSPMILKGRSGELEKVPRSSVDPERRPVSHTNLYRKVLFESGKKDERLTRPEAFFVLKRGRA